MVMGLILLLVLSLYFALWGIFASDVLAEGGTCCNDPNATCYINFGHVIIIQPGAYYSPSSCQPQ